MADKKVTLLPEKTTNVTNDEMIIIISGGIVKIVLASKFKWDPGESIQGTPGLPGSNGKSAYELWLDAGGTGTVNTFLNSLIWDDWKSAYQLWLSAGNNGSLWDFLASLNGTNGKSAYQLWKQDWNTGTVSDFLESLKWDDWVGTPWQDGATFDYRGDYDSGASYDVWFVVLFNWSGYVSLIDGNTTSPETVGNWWKIASKGLDGEGGDMYASNNLSEVDATLARVNLDVYSKAEVDSAVANVTVDAYTKAQSDAKYSLTTHDHSWIYEPVITKATAFNKEFWVIVGSVLEWNRDALYEKLSRKWVANGYVGLNASWFIDSWYLPSFVDDIIEVADFASLPATGETGKMYVTLDTDKLYRWGGSAYSTVSSNNMSDAHASTLTNGSNADPLHTHTFASLTSKPTTIAGYGITDAYNKTEIDTQASEYVKLTGNQTIGDIKTFSWDSDTDKWIIILKSWGTPRQIVLASPALGAWNFQWQLYLDWTSADLQIGTRDYKTAINILGSNGNVWIGIAEPISKLHTYWDGLNTLFDWPTHTYIGFGKAWVRKAYMGFPWSWLTRFEIKNEDVWNMNFVTWSNKFWFWFTWPLSTVHIYENTSELWSPAWLTIEQEGIGDAVLQLLRSWIIRWKVGSPSDWRFAISNGSLTDGLFNIEWSTVAVWRVGSVNTFVIRWDANTAAAISYLDSQPNKTMIVTHTSSNVRFYWKDSWGTKYQASLAWITI